MPDPHDLLPRADRASAVSVERPLDLPCGGISAQNARIHRALGRAPDRTRTSRTKSGPVRARAPCVGRRSHAATALGNCTRARGVPLPLRLRPELRACCGPLLGGCGECRVSRSPDALPPMFATGTPEAIAYLRRDASPLDPRARVGREVPPASPRSTRGRDGGVVHAAAEGAAEHLVHHRHYAVLPARREGGARERSRFVREHRRWSYVALPKDRRRPARGTSGR